MLPILLRKPNLKDVKTVLFVNQSAPCCCILNMYESKGLLSNSAKTANENAGFATPFGKSSLTSRKTLFCTKTKIAFGNLTNMNPSQKPTPSKSTPTQSSKVKLDDFIAVELAPKSNNLVELDEFTNQIIENDLMEAWNDKLVLTDKQFELLFLNPNVNTSPPTPPTTPIDLDFSSHLEMPAYECDFRGDFNVKSDENYDEDEFPSLNLSYIDDSWNEKPPNENDQNIVNVF